MQRLGCPVGTVRPFDRLSAQTDARKLSAHAQRLEHGTDEVIGEIELAREPVAEFQPEHVLTDVPHRGHANNIKGILNPGHGAEGTLGEARGARVTLRARADYRPGSGQEPSSAQ